MEQIHCLRFKNIFYLFCDQDGELEQTLPESGLPDDQMTSCPPSPNFPLVAALPLERCITAEGGLPSLSCFVPRQNTRKM